jgi:hypothetical protein
MEYRLNKEYLLSKLGKKWEFSGNLYIDMINSDIKDYGDDPYVITTEILFKINNLLEKENDPDALMNELFDIAKIIGQNKKKAYPTSLFTKLTGIVMWIGFIYFFIQDFHKYPWWGNLITFIFFTFFFYWYGFYPETKEKKGCLNLLGILSLGTFFLLWAIGDSLNDKKKNNE